MSSFGGWGHFVVEEVEELVDLVEAQGGFALFEVAHEAEAYAGFKRKVFLRQIILLAKRLYCC